MAKTKSSSTEPLPTLKTDVVIVGFGVAGSHTTAHLVRHGHSVIVVEPTGCHQFLTRLAAVAGGAQPESDAAVPIAEMFDVPVITERMVDVSGGAVTVESGQVIEGRVAVITAGAEPVEAPVTGLKHALALRSAGDALEIRRRVASEESVVIIGGGPTGCQLAGALSDNHPQLDVTLVDGSDRLLGSFPPQLGERAHQILQDRGVEVILEDEAAEMTKTEVRLESGRSIKGLPLWAAGFEATMDAYGTTLDGRLEIDAAGRLVGDDTLFAAGDAAAHTDDNGDVHPMSAQIAAQAGRQVGKNVARLLDGEAAKPISLKDLGWVVDMTGGAGIAEVLGVKIAHPTLDPLVPIMHEAIDWRNLFQLGGPDFVIRFRPGAMSEINA